MSNSNPCSCGVFTEIPFCCCCCGIESVVWVKPLTMIQKLPPSEVVLCDEALCWMLALVIKNIENANVMRMQMQKSAVWRIHITISLIHTCNIATRRDTQHNWKKRKQDRTRPSANTPSATRSMLVGMSPLDPITCHTTAANNMETSIPMLIQPDGELKSKRKSFPWESKHINQKLFTKFTCKRLQMVALNLFAKFQTDVGN